MNKNKEFFELKGRVTFISDIIHIKRIKVPDLYKRILTVETEDGHVLFPELRNTKLRLTERENIQIGDEVTIWYSFEGSEKNGKRYNNIYIGDIKKN